MNATAYVLSPLKHQGTIPVFSQTNDYTQNYERISEDHLVALDNQGHNPFMDEVLWQEMEESTLSLINKHCPQGGKILDVGVGLGRLLSKLGPHFQKYGVDISSRYLERAASKNIEVCLALVEELPYRENYFDVIVCTDVLEHVLDLNVAVRKILSVLKPGGKLIVRVPYRESLRGYVGSKYQFVHLRNFDEYSLQLFFEKIMGVPVIEFSTIGGLITREHLKSYFPNVFKIAWHLAIHGTKFISSALWRTLANRFYPHSEINMVVQKRPLPPAG